MSMTSFSIERPISTLMMYLAFMMLGVFALFRMPVELMPNSQSGSLTVTVGIRGGLPPEDIETLVTKVIEDAVSSTAKLKGMMSVSRKERAVVTMQFEPGTDLSYVALDVQERIAKIRNKLPRDIEKPLIAHYNEADYPVVILALTSDKFTPEQLRDLVDNNLKPALARVDGVANIEVGGGRERKILVEFDQGRLQAYQLPIQRIIGELGVNNLNILTGKTKDERNSYYVRAMGQFQTIDEMKKLGIAVTKEGSRIRLGDVAEVRDFYMEATSFSRLNRKPNVAVYIQKESQSNTIKAARKIQQVMKRFKTETMPPGVEMIVVSDQSIFIREAISNVIKALYEGALFTAIILWIFVKDLKHTAIILVSLPLSVILTFGMMYLSKIGINVMTLSGLALGIGMLVDNSIVVLFRIIQNKQDYFAKHPGVDRVDSETSKDLVLHSCREIVLPIFASTLACVIVFIPIMFINKQIQILYTGLALTVTYSLVCSFFVALTIIPMLAIRIPMERQATEQMLSDGQRLFLLGLWGKTKAILDKTPLSGLAVKAYEKGRIGARLLWGHVAARTQPKHRDPKYVYRRLRSLSVRHRYRLLLYVFIAFLIAGYAYGRFLEKDFMGSTEQDEFVIFVELPSGTKLGISDQVVGEVEKILSEDPDIKGMVKTAAARVEGWSSKVYVTVSPQSERTRTVQEIIDNLRPKVAEVGAVYDAFVYFSEPSSSKEFLIDLFGLQYEKLRDIAVAVSKELGTISGLADVKLRYKPGQPEIKIIVDKDRAALFGFTVKDIAETLHAQIRGLRATYFYTQNLQIETVARLQEKDRKTVEDLNYLTIVGPDGTIVPLMQLSSMEYGLTPSEIYRKDKQRMIQVSANRESLALGKAAKLTMAKLRKLDFPTGYYYQVGGDFEQMLDNEREFRFAFFIMVGLLYILLACLFESYAVPLLIMLTVPLAVISVVPVLLIGRISVTIGVYLGLIMLGGKVVTDAILLLERIQETKPGENILRAVLKAANSRLKAIALVQLTTILGLLPMIWDKSSSSSLWSPLAITVVGGIIGATILSMFVVPACYLMIRDLDHYRSRLEQKNPSAVKPVEGTA